MFAPLLGAIRADIDRQVGWAKDEVRRQTRYATLTGVLAGVAALAALGAIVVGRSLPLAVDASRSVHRACRDWRRFAAACGAAVRTSLHPKSSAACRATAAANRTASGSARGAQAGQLRQDCRRGRAGSEACHRDAASGVPISIVGDARICGNRRTDCWPKTPAP